MPAIRHQLFRHARTLGLMTGVLLTLSAGATAKPNVVVLLVDDAGFMDFGGYGGEASTPHIDQLANQGVRFSNYHTSPLCATSRAMLLTGLDSHKTGMGTLPESITEEQKGLSAYALRLHPGIETIAERLGDAGYDTFMTGKWHLGRKQGDLPDSHGFDRSFVLDASGADNWEQKPFVPFYEEAPWFEDGEPANLPDDFYSSEFLVDKMLEYIKARDADTPFFAYIAFQAIHIPIQAPREFTDRYTGVYEDGWQATLERRFQRAKALGLVASDIAIPQMHPSLRTWDSLSAEEQIHYERSMMVNAGMLEAMDHHIGRLVAYLKSRNELDNTIFIVTSDNGPEYGDPATTSAVFRLWMRATGYHTDPERAGEKGYMGAIGPEWASAASVPGSLFKMYASEGGTRVPLIISAPGLYSPVFNDALSFVTDLAPTIVELTGINSPADMDGRSLLPLLTGEASRVYGEDEPLIFEVAGNSAVFKGDHKLTRNTLPHGDGQWRLHNLSQDPAEAQDLSAQQPEFRQKLLEDYENYAASVGVVALPEDFDINAQIDLNVRNEMVSRHGVTIVGILLAVFFTALATVLLVRRRARRTD